MENEEFKPNQLREADVDSLEDWKLLVAACHYGPNMSDCVFLDYGYSISEDGVISCGKDSIAEDIDLKNPMEAIKRYVELSWQDMLRDYLKRTLREYW